MRLYTDDELYHSLKELNVIPLDLLSSAYKESNTKKASFSEILFKKNLISDSNLGKVIADLINAPFVSLSEVGIDDDVLKIIPEVVAEKQKIIAFKKDKEGLHLAMNNPKDEKVKDFVEKKVGVPVKVYYATERDVSDALTRYSKDVKEVFDEIIEESLEKVNDPSKAEPSIIKIVFTIISHAYKNRASDVHIEPSDEESLVRFRIDGILHDIVSLPLNTHEQVVTRVKVLSSLRTDEHQEPQDGKINIEVEKEDLDVRVSIVPVTDGEKIVMRLLSERSRQFTLQDLGFSEPDLKKVEDAYNKPHGMILSTGPTGSGKTTTLYAILKLLNKRDVNIMTIEDPVEYDIEGVNQIQVNLNTKLNFSKGLRSIVRQDPDIILVGEIRDEETADISINAAMTGHLVLSTLHTNDSSTSIPRLLDMNVEPFLIASTVNVIIAQRLVRKICTNCRVSQEIDNKSVEKNGTSVSELVKKYFGEGDIRVYRGKGCNVCHDTGFVGRIGIFEVLLINDEIREAVNERKDASDIKEIAVKVGMTTMLEDGVAKVKEGVTTLEEILRVTKE